MNKEWFCVPLKCIDDAIEHIKDKTIVDYRYDAEEAVIKKIQ